MDVEDLIGTMIEGTLLGRGKRSRGARGFLRGGGSPFLNASTLLTVGGLVWGAIETMQQQGTAAAPAPASPPARMGETVPPLPAAAAAAPSPVAMDLPPEPPLPEGAEKLVRLMVSAARADGELTDVEKQAVLDHARRAGAERVVAGEFDRATPLATIVQGIDDPQQRSDLYVLAYSIVRADEAVTGSEQIYLAQLAGLLGLDEHATRRLEDTAAARIEAAKGG